jgi:RNA polymerase sigma-70 factor (ECF subfamily)
MEMTARRRISAADVDASAFEVVYVAYSADLLRYAQRRVGRDTAPDILAEVLLIAWRRRGEIRSEDSRLWLFGVAHRVVANELRRRGRQARLQARAERQAGTVVDDPADAVADVLLVRQVLSLLPWREQEALRLVEWDQLSPREAAIVAGCEQTTFRVRLHRARRHFTARLQASGLSSRTTSSQDLPEGEET